MFDTRLQNHWDAAELAVNQPQYEEPETGKLDIGGYVTAEIIKAPLCTHWGQKGPAWPYEQCKRPAGHKTNHEGVGLCWQHGGHRGSGKIQGAVLMAFAYAEELNVSPWEALLSQVRLLANQVEWLRIKVVDAEREKGEAAIRPGGDSWDLVVLLEARGERLAKTAKMAIDAGVAERLVRQIELEAEAMFRAALAGLDAAGIEGAVREKMLAGMAGKMLEIEAEQKVI